VSNKPVHDDLRALANGINHVLATRFPGTIPEFMLILVEYGENDTVTLNTITGIIDPHKVRTIGEHLIELAKAQQGQALDPDSDSDVKGHA